MLSIGRSGAECPNCVRMARLDYNRCMTKAISHRPLKRPGRKPSEPPADAADRICALASDGFSIIGIARQMGVGKDAFAGWLDRNPALKDAFDAGREMERHALHNLLYRQAMEQGNATAAMFLLKARHGYREGDQSAQGDRVSVTIALPGAMTLQQFTAITERKSNGQGYPESH